MSSQFRFQTLNRDILAEGRGERLGQKTIPPNLLLSKQIPGKKLELVALHPLDSVLGEQMTRRQNISAESIENGVDSSGQVVGNGQVPGTAEAREAGGLVSAYFVVNRRHGLLNLDVPYPAGRGNLPGDLVIVRVSKA